MLIITGLSTEICLPKIFFIQVVPINICYSSRHNDAHATTSVLQILYKRNIRQSDAIFLSLKRDERHVNIHYKKYSWKDNTRTKYKWLCFPCFIYIRVNRVLVNCVYIIYLPKHGYNTEYLAQKKDKPQIQFLKCFYCYFPIKIK